MSVFNEVNKVKIKCRLHCVVKDYRRLCLIRQGGSMRLEWGGGWKGEGKEGTRGSG